jgi:hypothetical protein
MRASDRLHHNAGRGDHAKRHNTLTVKPVIVVVREALHRHGSFFLVPSASSRLLRQST